MAEKRPYGTGKDEMVRFRISKEQKEKLFEYAKVAGVSVSAFILGKCLGDFVGGKLVNK